MRKKMRTPVAVMVVLGIGLSGTPSALADTGATAVLSTSTTSSSPSGSTSETKPAISQAQALSTATQLLPIPTGLTMSGETLQQHWLSYNQPVYDIQWQGPQPSAGFRGNAVPQFAHAIVDATTGDILSFNGGFAPWYASSTSTQEQAAQAARNWVNKLAPTYADQMSLQSNSGNQIGGAYSFQFVRMVNGVPAPFDGAQVTIGPDGSLVGYQFSWHQVSFPSATGAVSASDAASTYESALGLHLSYVNQYQLNGLQKVVLSYSPQSTNNVYTGFSNLGPWIDATTGKAIGEDGNTLSTSSVVFTPLDSSVSPQWPTKLGTPLDQSDAEAVARKAFNFGSNTKLLSANSGGYAGPGYSGTQWDFTFQPAGSTATVQVSVDAETGIVANYFQMTPSAPSASSTTITADQAQQDAINFVKQAYPTLVGALALNPSRAEQGSNQFGETQYTVTFAMLQNGIPTNNTAFVSVNAAGHITNVNVPPFAPQATYPASSSVITLTQAEQAYVNEAPLQLAYELPATQSNQPNGSQIQFATEAVLAYAPEWNNSGSVLDATSGQWVSISGQGGPAPIDIAGHIGASEINELASIGVLPVTEGKANPDQTVTRAQFVNWLVGASQSSSVGNPNRTQDFSDVSPTDANYATIHTAVQEGWLTAGGAFNPNQPMTRADAADMIVRWLGWASLASQSNLFINPFSDEAQITADRQGDAILVNDLGIIPAVNGQFLPNNNMTVADAAVAIVHAFRVSNSVQ